MLSEKSGGKHLKLRIMKYYNMNMEGYIKHFEGMVKGSGYTQVSDDTCMIPNCQNKASILSPLCKDHR